jgi:hypothetical protein
LWHSASSFLSKKNNFNKISCFRSWNFVEIFLDYQDRPFNTCVSAYILEGKPEAPRSL